jgi:hypothetical protein
MARTQGIDHRWHPVLIVGEREIWVGGRRVTAP